MSDQATMPGVADLAETMQAPAFRRDPWTSYGGLRRVGLRRSRAARTDRRRRPAPERVLHVLAGELELTVDRMQGRSQPHTYGHVPSNAHHRLAASGPEPLRLLSAWSTDPVPGDPPD
jgi:hypothetical protein